MNITITIGSDWIWNILRVVRNAFDDLHSNNNVTNGRFHFEPKKKKEDYESHQFTVQP